MIHVVFIGVITVAFCAFVIGILNNLREGHSRMNAAVTFGLLIAGMMVYGYSLYLAIKGIMMG